MKFPSYGLAVQQSELTWLSTSGLKGPSVLLTAAPWWHTRDHPLQAACTDRPAEF